LADVASAATIDRPRLIARLQEERRHRITVLVAPAGYGKSTLVRGFLARPDVQPAVLYRVRSGQRSPIGFVRGLVESLASALRLPPLHEYVYANGAHDHDGLREWLTQAIAPFAGTIAVDDLHVATSDETCARFAASVIDEAGPSIRWVLATRSVENLPLASWQSRGEAGDPIGEVDLGLTAHESVRLSHACGLAVSDQIIDHLAGLTKGWPAAFAFGIRLAAKGVAEASVATYTQAFIDDLFAEQVLSALHPEQRDFLLDTSLLTRVDPALLSGRYGFDPDGMLRSLRRDVAFVALDGRGGYAYHDLFKDFLRREVRKESAGAVDARVRRAAALLLEAGEPDAALDLCLDLDSSTMAAELLERVGFLLIEGGYVDVVERAAQRLDAVAPEHPMLYGVRATLESMHGNYVRAEELFARAIDAASGELATELRIRLATHRLNRRDTAGAWDAIRACRAEGVRPELRLSLLTIAACIGAREGDVERARPPLDAAISLLAELRDEAQVAVAHHQIALVLYLLGHFERARAYATSAVQLAERRRIAGVAARARSVLSAVAGELGNAGVQRQINHDLRTLARGARDPKLLFFALANLFAIEIEAGHLAVARAMEAELHLFDATLFRDSEEALYPAYALRAAWEGEFGVAYAYLRGTDAGLSPETRGLLRRCEIALYAVACGETDEGRRLADNAVVAFERWGDDRRTLHSRALLARILLALAQTLLDEPRVATRLLENARYATAAQRRAFDRFVLAARAFVRARATGDDRVALPLARLRDSDLGGYALLIESLGSVPALRTFADPPSALTAAERAVLERLSRGLTSKEIAAAFGKSRYTIDTQVKSIVRKFGCSGRGEAVYLARRYGMID
jgi:ATP/maltotriose-dependent transcriptional regulator MalT